MSSNYMYPTIISLENLDFEKLDILPGTAKFAVADFAILNAGSIYDLSITCLLYTSPSPRDQRGSRMPSSA